MIKIKKLTLILSILLILTGCTSKEQTIKNPNGKSETYQFFKNQSQDKYTLKLKNSGRDITIIQDENKRYYEVSDYNETTIIIEKDKQKYTLNSQNQTYTKQNIDKYTDYALGYLPKNIKNQAYKTGKERINLLNYTYEKYVYSGGTTTYYLRNKKLKYIKNQTPLNETTVEFVSISSKINQNKFNIPKEYQELEY